MQIQVSQFCFQICLLLCNVALYKTTSADPHQNDFNYIESAIDLRGKFRPTFMQHHIYRDVDIIYQDQEKRSHHQSQQHQLQHHPKSKILVGESYNHNGGLEGHRSTYEKYPYVSDKTILTDKNTEYQYESEQDEVGDDPEIFVNSDIVYVTKDELTSLFNFYIDEANHNHNNRREEFHLQPIYQPSVSTGATDNLVKNHYDSYRDDSSMQINIPQTLFTTQIEEAPSLSHVPRYIFSPKPHLQQTQYQMFANMLKPIEDISSIEQSESIQSTAVTNVHDVGQLYKHPKTQNNVTNYSNWFPPSNETEHKVTLPGRKLFNTNPSAIKYRTRKDKQTKQSKALTNQYQNKILPNTKTKTNSGLKVVNVTSDEYIEISIPGSPRRKIRLIKGRRRQKPFKRGPLIRKSIKFQIPFSNESPETWDPLGSDISFESKKVNNSESSWNEANDINPPQSSATYSLPVEVKKSNFIKNESEFQELNNMGTYFQDMEEESTSSRRYPKSITLNGTLHNFIPIPSPTANNNKGFTQETHLRRDPSRTRPPVKTTDHYQKFRNFPKLEFPFPTSYIKGLLFLIKGHEHLGPHIIVEAPK